ncbi:class I SAM-dependent methyltransferase [Staphylococcus sp. 30400_3112M30941]|nr:class I SAM-dependent methyltransferase [Staphylococcus sp. 30403_3112M30944]MBO0946403.1 class I SAM-dependent methyltransferase [Staphylococcus sp. 30402_3112M30943]MBO0964545.1 class I SAM-dependent methyltransferase [Staphylococcus sp. 30400_3112M30941]MBO0966898.1 class I SAM-dependent methyltransferase [Staphylococcus sp. 30401_3112M30942]
MSQYAEMSLVYDQLTQDQPYEKWYELVANNCENGSNILDIGCGTGSLTVQLVNLGQVTGMDLSIDMLTVASQKSTSVNWIEGDMTSFDLQQKFDVITIFCDSLNYLQDENAVIETFKKIYNHLNDSGVFMFDVHTVHKMMTLFNNQSYIDDRDGIFLAWDAIQGDLPLSVYHDMSFFIRNEDQTYSRFDESHFQRTFEEATYLKWLTEIGFNHIKTFTDFDENEHNEHADRLFFIVKK